MVVSFCTMGYLHIQKNISIRVLTKLETSLRHTFRKTMAFLWNFSTHNFTISTISTTGAEKNQNKTSLCTYFLRYNVYNHPTQHHGSMQHKLWSFILHSIIPGWVFTKPQLVNFPVKDIFCFRKGVHVNPTDSHSYLAGVIAANLRWHISNMNLILIG